MIGRLRAATDRPVALVRRHPQAATIAGLLVMMALSSWLRTQALWSKFWIDEGISVGIANHGFFAIPGLLQQDGAPPFYYMLLHLWMGLVGGDGEARTHALSVLAAVVAIPAVWWWGRRLFGAASGWASAALMATLPFVTYYAQETRMYALVVLFGTIATGAFATAFVLRDRRALPVFVLFGALTPYTHNWGLFMLVGLAVAWAWLVRTAPAGERRDLIRDGLIAFGAIGLLYLPWVPTLLEQARTTGAPWATRPNPGDLLGIAEITLGGATTALAIALVGGPALLRMRRGESERFRVVVVLLIVFATTLLLAWLLSQISPAWSRRYVAVAVGPALLLAGAGLVRAGRVGLIALLVTVAVWWTPQVSTIRTKSNAFKVTRILELHNQVVPGDAVLVLHPEYTPTVRYYLGPDFQWFDALGPVPDPQIFDWRDALTRLESAGPRRTLARILPQIPRGRRLIVFFPIIDGARWNAPWTSLVRRRSGQWQHALDTDSGLAREWSLKAFGWHRPPRGLRVIVYRRV